MRINFLRLKTDVPRQELRVLHFLCGQSFIQQIKKCGVFFYKNAVIRRLCTKEKIFIFFVIYTDLLVLL